MVALTRYDALGVGDWETAPLTFRRFPSPPPILLLNLSLFKLISGTYTFVVHQALLMSIADERVPP